MSVSYCYVTKEPIPKLLVQNAICEELVGRRHRLVCLGWMQRCSVASPPSLTQNGQHVSAECSYISTILAVGWTEVPASFRAAGDVEIKLGGYVFPHNTHLATPQLWNAAQVLRGLPCLVPWTVFALYPRKPPEYPRSPTYSPVPGSSPCSLWMYQVLSTQEDAPLYQLLFCHSGKRT